ncbi:methylated-DNA--[protein]-cysteine S-methyltransferase [Pectinatus brassicae]|uniref:Methylated-DNA--protein-cysteine methyltransferase n=1 Tax=Pectinatus brassicae TaxID=862415 RepID=A0A840UE91_9FIRM|nr:methylated-DNA--[protein]-cysteine S-methyltransferase [Pectinatus brassicae]MBB5335349.1 methylated-DNA-[protein]-cysteine S-methyltransferase [Pectinatus brassicae]
MKKRFSYQTKIGNIYITEDKSSIVGINFKKPLTPAEEVETLLMREAFTQIEEYLAGRRKEFRLPLKPKGTYFQEKVWEELQKIPYGHTVSYKEIAQAIGQPKAMRAVGQANNKNNIAICIPCHRVISADGKLSGYAGGVKVKQFLLDLEREVIKKEGIKNAI